MDFTTYQIEALKTDKTPVDPDGQPGRAIEIALLGLSGEPGTLLSEYKKFLRDGTPLTQARVREELGDTLWYLANIASKYGLDLGEIAEANLQKICDRFLPTGNPGGFDGAFPAHERLPRRFSADFTPADGGGPARLTLTIDGASVGDVLDDNAATEDGYRFHDALHLAFASQLGWSPVLRRLLGRKRKSDPETDRVQDGGRAAVVEEAIVALAFEYAQRHKLLADVTALDAELLRTIRGMAAPFDAGRCRLADWESAILQGFAVWRSLTTNGGGRVIAEPGALRFIA